MTTEQMDWRDDNDPVWQAKLKREREAAEGPHLDGATTAPPEGVMLKDAGEFAAMWNACTPAKREALVKTIQSSAQEGYTCFIENHVGIIANLRQEKGLVEVDLNRFAQYLYEAIGELDTIHLNMNMVDKPDLVAALKAAIERLGN
jgi:hypothetical protein